MQCPNCHAEVREGAAFCGSCGVALTAPAQPPAPEPAAEAPAPAEPSAEVPAPAPDMPAPTQPLEAPVPPPPPPMPAPTQPLPPSAAQQPASSSADYAAQTPAAQGYPVQPGAPAVPPKKSKAPLVIAIVVIALLLLCGCAAVAGVLTYLPVFERIEEVTPEGPETTVTPVEPAGYATAEEAVRAALEAEDIGDWVYQIYEESGGTVVYWAGPPASEWVYAITVQQAADGSWEVVSFDTLDLGGGDVSEGDLTPLDQAIDVVGEHLYAVKQDRGMDAQALTVDPFRSDPASAQEAAGALASFEVTEANEQSDGTFWVRTVQNWTWGTERWEYWVVPTEAGYRIADIRSW